MHAVIVDDHEVLWDGQRVWINGPDGCSRARYDSRSQVIDVHRPLAEQAEHGQCLDCGRGDYDAFVASVKRHFNLNLPPEAKPQPP